MNCSCELISFVVCAYNQEGTVKEAIESALQQTYSPLEIIVSDDCSTDSTHEVIRSTLSTYVGPHTIVINKNASNLGIARHWDYISRKAKGRLVVHAAGDDISLPERVTELHRAWISVQPRPYLLSSNGLSMTISGMNKSPLLTIANSNEVLVQSGPIDMDFDKFKIYVLGFSLAVDKRLYERLEPLKAWMWSEDDILRSRALLLGSIAFLPRTLVRYRDGGLSKGAIPSQKSYIKRFMDQAISRLNYLEQLVVDFKNINGTSYQFSFEINKKITFAKRRLKFIETKNIFISFIHLVLLLGAYRDEGVSKKQFISMFLVKWFPWLFFKSRDFFGKNRP